MTLLRRLALILSALPMLVSAQTLPTFRIGLAEDPDVLDPTLARSFVGRVVFAGYEFSPPWRRAGLRDMAARRTRWPVSLKAPARAADSAVASCRSRR